MIQNINEPEYLNFKRIINLENMTEEEGRRAIKQAKLDILDELLYTLYKNNYISLCTTTNSVNKNVEVCARICARKE